MELFLENGSSLLLEGALGPLLLEDRPVPSPGIALLLQDGEPVLLESDAMGALLLDHIMVGGAGAGPDKKHKKRRGDEWIADDDSEVLQIIKRFLGTLDL